MCLMKILIKEKKMYRIDRVLEMSKNKLIKYINI